MMSENYQEGLILNVPVKLSYAVLEKVIEEKLQQEDGSAGKGLSNYAEVKFAWLEKNPEIDYDITLGLRLKTKTFLLRNKEIELKIHLKFDFDASTNQFRLEKYQAVGENENWLFDKLVQLILNKILQKKVLQKSQQDLSAKLKQELAKINTKIAEKNEPAKGVLLDAHLDQLNISHLQFAPQHVVIYLSVMGEAVLEITELPEEAKN